MALSDMGKNLNVQEFKLLSEKEKFAYVFVAVKAITHLEVASKKADTVLERSRSVFGAYNLKKNLELGKKIYEDNS